MTDAKIEPSSESIDRLRHELNSLKSVIHVTLSISSILDLEQLLDRAVHLIQDHFSYFYIHLYLIDHTEHWAVLRAGTGQIGKILLERKYKVEINNSTLVGKCIQEQIACLVGNNDANFISLDPIRDDVKSAIALPLISRNKIIGVLEIQDIGCDAFTSKDVPALQMMANQLAVTIENAQFVSKLTKSDISY
jgi:GAF domain-containing protein